ncbi:PREDICTED: uncharacterized protein LOC109581029 isoform X2 [Amphimedon queenslandica]|nr:PREDICTED: uncharacterized protein LOC109581029 isoform X2 [Amphimedon queenslandica]|eukprot:XP_019850309.1 PREDICTED: uncharacterized protein LOC109581029 isoform X2 [Amphimedon queenslandica]
MVPAFQSNDATAVPTDPAMVLAFPTEPSYSNKNNAHKVLTSSNDMLTKIDLMYLADKMVEKGIITSEQKREIVDDRYHGLSGFQRINKLLDHLRDTVEVNEGTFQWFIKILNDYNTVWSKSVAKKLMDKYTELQMTS